MKNSIQISEILKDDIKNQENDKNLNILDFMYKYFILYIDTKKGSNISKNSLISINFILENFFTFISDQFTENESLNINDMTKYFLYNYLTTLSNKLSKSSQKLHFTIIKNFLFFIADYDIKKYGFIKININGMKIKTEQKEKESFTQNEQTLILKYITNKLDTTNSFLAQRNSLIIKILLFAGLRISELINIKWSDISEFNDETHGILYSILIMGKGGKERYAYLQYNLIVNNLEWLKKHSSNEYIFTSTHGNRCNPSMIFVVINNILAKAGTSHRGLHIFRHTFARNLVNKDINLATIKDLLGHSNISVTAQFYAKSNENAKRNALFGK